MDTDYKARFKVPYPQLSDKRGLRYSSLEKENNVKSVEKVLFQNAFMHDRYQVSLDCRQSFDHARHVLDESNLSQEQ